MLDGASAGATPKFNVKEEKKQKFTWDEMYDKRKVCVCDVEHIAQLYKYILSTPQMQKHKMGVWGSESDVKMEVDDDGTKHPEYEEDDAKTKEHIMFHNQVYGLVTLMSRKLKNGKDLSLMKILYFP